MKRMMYAALAATVALPMLTTAAAAQQDRGYGYSPSGEAGYQWSENRGMNERDAYAGEGRAPNPPRTPDRYITDWNQPEQGRGYPRHPSVSENYNTAWDRYGGGERGPGWRPGADDRWAERPNYDRDFDRPGPAPGYRDDRGGYDRGWGNERGGYDRGWGDQRGGSDRGWGDQRGYDAAGRGWQRDGRNAGYGRDDMRDDHRGGADPRGFGPYADHGWGGNPYSHPMHPRHHGRADMDFRRDFEQDGRRGYYQDPTYEQMGHLGRAGDRRTGRDAGPADMRQVREAMRMIDRFDIDGDNRVTQEEVDRYRSDRLGQFDTDQDQQLTLDEYSALWADAMRERMVRRFQSHDRDGDGRVTAAEFSDQTRDLVGARDRNRDSALSEDDFRRPRVEAPLTGGSPNQPAERQASGDGGVGGAADRPEVEAPLGSTPNEADTGATTGADTGATTGTGTGAATGTGTGTASDVDTQVEDEDTTDTSTN